MVLWKVFYAHAGENAPQEAISRLDRAAYLRAGLGKVGEKPAGHANTAGVGDWKHEAVLAKIFAQRAPRPACSFRV